MRARPRSRAAAAALVLLAMAPGAGCSWTYVRKAPEPPLDPGASPACTTSVELPVLDTAGAVVFAALGAASLAWAASGRAPSDLWAAVAYLGGVGDLGYAATFGLSAGYGYAATARCREVVALERACREGAAGACRLLRGPAEGEARPP